MVTVSMACVPGLYALTAYFVVADVGPKGELGEGSIRLADALGFSSDPHRGGCSSGVRYVVFLGSSKGWPRSEEDMLAQVEPLFEAWGGEAKLGQV